MRREITIVFDGPALWKLVVATFWFMVWATLGLAINAYWPGHEYFVGLLFGGIWGELSGRRANAG